MAYLLTFDMSAGWVSFAKLLLVAGAFAVTLRFIQKLAGRIGSPG